MHEVILRQWLDIDLVYWIHLNSVNARDNCRINTITSLLAWNRIAMVAYILCMACRWLVISYMQKNGIHGNNSAAAVLSMNGSFAAKSHYKTYRQFSFISRRILSFTLESILYWTEHFCHFWKPEKVQSLMGFFFRVKLCSYRESFRIIFKSAYSSLLKIAMFRKLRMAFWGDIPLKLVKMFSPL